jgi:hypothetical protein
MSGMVNDIIHSKVEELDKCERYCNQLCNTPEAKSFWERLTKVPDKVWRRCMVECIVNNSK